MEPTLKPGETAVVDRELQEFDQTGIYLVQVSGTRMLRRFRRAMDGSIRVSCDNSARYPEIETIESIEKLEVMGRVVSKVIVQAVNWIASWLTEGYLKERGSEARRPFSDSVKENCRFWYMSEVSSHAAASQLFKAGLIGMISPVFLLSMGRQMTGYARKVITRDN